MTSSPESTMTGEITRSETVVFRKSDLVESPVVDMSTPKDSSSASSENGSSTPSSSSNCEIESLREALQQALEDKAELIEESFLDKERIRDQKETIELLTKRVREFEMSFRTTTSMTSVSSSSSSNRSNLHSQIKQLSEDNIQLAKEVDRLVAERDKLEKKLIDMKIKLRRTSSIASTDEDDNELNVFSDYERKRKTKSLGPNKKGGNVFAAAKNWFANKSYKKSSPKKSSSFNRTIAV
jgi:hypothetical protein